MFKYSKPDQSYLDSAKTVSEESPDILVNFDAAYEYTRALNRSSSPGHMVVDVWQPIIDRINEDSDRLFENPGRNLTGRVLGLSKYDTEVDKDYLKDADNVINFIKSNEDKFPDLIDIDHKVISERSRKLALDIKEKYDTTVDESDGVLNLLARLAGEISSAANDPKLIGMSLAFQPFVRSASLVGAVTREAIIGAGVEAIIQDDVKDWYETLGLDYTYEQFVASVVAGGVIGGGTPLAISIGGKTISISAEKAAEGYRALTGSGAYKPTRQTDSVFKFGENGVHYESQSATSDFATHAKRLREAEKAFNNSTPPNMTKEMGALPDTAGLYYMENTKGIVTRFTPKEISVDNINFPARKGAPAIKAKDWDEINSGQILTYEFLDGRKVVVDGHKRLALAKDIASKDPSKDIPIMGINLREADGYTPSQARQIAASKNEFMKSDATQIFTAMQKSISRDFDLGEARPRAAETGDFFQSVKSSIEKDAETLELFVSRGLGSDVDINISKRDADLENRSLENLAGFIDSDPELSRDFFRAQKYASDTGDLDGAIQDFLGSFRRGVNEGRLDRASSGNARRAGSSTTSKDVPVDEEEFDGFSGPKDDGGFRRQANQLELDIFGRVADVSDEAIESDAAAASARLGVDKDFQFVDVDEAGNEVRKTLRQIREDSVQDQKMIDRLKGCIE